MVDDDEKLYRADTVPPPAGAEGEDAYNAPTKVGPMSAAIQEMILAAEKKATEMQARANEKSAAKPASPPPAVTERVVEGGVTDARRAPPRPEPHVPRVETAAVAEARAVSVGAQALTPDSSGGEEKQEGNAAARDEKTAEADVLERAVEPAFPQGDALPRLYDATPEDADEPANSEGPRRTGTVVMNVNRPPPSSGAPVSAPPAPSRNPQPMMAQARPASTPGERRLLIGLLVALLAAIGLLAAFSLGR
jgi:hypothetical protein